MPHEGARVQEASPSCRTELKPVLWEWSIKMGKAKPRASVYLPWMFAEQRVLEKKWDVQVTTAQEPAWLIVLKKRYHQAQDPHHCHTSENTWSRKALTCLSRTPPPVSLYPFYPPSPSFPISSLLPHHSSNRVCCSYSTHAVQGLTGGGVLSWFGVCGDSETVALQWCCGRNEWLDRQCLLLVKYAQPLLSSTSRKESKTYPPERGL